MRFFAFILFLAFGVSAQEPPPPPPIPTVTHFVRSETRVSKNVIYLFDCSNSMGRANRFRTALTGVNALWQSPVDDGMFSLITFKADTYELKSWPGFKEKNDPNPPPDGWAKLPSAHAVKSANKFLNNAHCGGYTDLGSGIQSAFELNLDREKTTLIIFTDGNNTYPEFSGKPPSRVVALIHKLQKIRMDQKKDRINIFVFGVSVEQNVLMLSAIARAGGGSYITTDNVCPICRVNTIDVPEIQRYHRSGHTNRFDEEEEEEEEEEEDED